MLAGGAGGSDGFSAAGRRAAARAGLRFRVVLSLQVTLEAEAHPALPGGMLSLM